MPSRDGNPRRAAERRRALRVEMTTLRRRIDHRVVRYVDRGRWVSLAWRGCRSNRSTGSMLLGLAVVAAALRFGLSALRGSADRYRGTDLRRVLQELLEAIRGDSSVSGEGAEQRAEREVAGEGKESDDE